MFYEWNISRMANSKKSKANLTYKYTSQKIWPGHILLFQTLTYAVIDFFTNVYNQLQGYSIQIMYSVSTGILTFYPYTYFMYFKKPMIANNYHSSLNDTYIF